jgi:hypothetical protein
MIKWIGQHIFDLISRFRTTVYLENLETSTETNILVVDSDGKVTKNADAGDDMSFTVEDGDTTDVVISDGKHWKFVEGGNININWTDTDNGTSSDEYDLTFTGASLQELLVSASHNIRGIAGSDVTIASAQDIKFHIDYDQSETAGTHTFDFVNGTGSVVASIDESGVPTFSIGAKGSTSSAVLVDGGSGAIKSRTLAEFKGDASLGNVEDKSSATIRGEIVDGNIPALATSKITSGTFDDARIPSLAASKVTSGTFDAARIPTLNQDTSGTATNATKQVVVTHHHFFMNSSSTTTDFFFPYNNLNEASSVSQYYTRTIAPYAGRIVKVLIRPSAAIGTACKLQFHKITDTTLNFGTATEEVTSINLNTAETSVSTALSSATFSAGDVVNVSLIKSSTATANIQAVIVWEYTT